MKKITKLSTTILILSSLAIADTAIADAKNATQSANDLAMKTTDVQNQFSSNSTVSDASADLTQSINLGYAGTTGKIDTTNFNALYKASFTTEGYGDKALKVGFDASGFLTNASDSDKVEEYSVNLGVEQLLTDTWLGYANANWYRNENLGYKNKMSIGAGIGKEIFANETHVLSFKLGVAQNFSDFASFSDVADLDTENYATLNQYIEYNRILNDTSNLYLKIGAAESFDNFSDIEGIGVLGINFSVANKVSVSIEEEVRYNGLSVVGDLLDKKTSTKTVVRIGYNF